MRWWDRSREEEILNLARRRLTAGGLNTDKTFSGVIAGSGAFTKSGSGTLDAEWSEYVIRVRRR